MKHRPFFSIIIPTYNQTNYIEECISSVLSQSCQDFEIIVSDDSESNETETIISSFQDSRILYFRNLPRLGRVQNYRTCVVERAIGEWCLICDGDDYLTDANYLSDAMSIIEHNPSVVLVQAGHYKGSTIDAASVETPSIPEDEQLFPGIDYLMKFKQLSHFSHLSTITNLELLKKINPFRLDILSADMETYLRLASFGDVHLLKKPVGFWRQHQNNASSSSGISSLIKNLAWAGSVSSFWERVSPDELHFSIKKWETDVSENAIRYLYKDMIRKKTVDWPTLAIFIKEAYKMGFLIHLISDRQTYLYFIKFLRSRQF